MSLGLCGALCAPVPSLAQGTGTPADRAKTPPMIQASPNPVPAGPGEGSTTVTWTTGDDSDGRVQVAINGGIEEVFARGGTGASIANFIDASSVYEFRLYAAATPFAQSKLLARVTVRRAPPGALSTTPPPPAIKATTDSTSAAHVAPVTITWSTGDGSDGLVFVRTSSGQPAIFAQGPSGSETADWLDGHLAYEFQLFSRTTPQSLLAKVTVPARLAAVGDHREPGMEEIGPDFRARSFLIAIPNPVPAGVTSGATEISWGLGAGTGKVLMSVGGNPPTEFAVGSGGTLPTAIRAGSTYRFSLYSDKAPDVLIATVVVTRARPYFIWLGLILLVSVLFLLVRYFVKSSRRP
jgi:hypothetical protein